MRALNTVRKYPKSMGFAMLCVIMMVLWQFLSLFPVASQIDTWCRQYTVDLGVYAAGGETMRHFGQLYAESFHNYSSALTLAFTYPPFAALTFVPMSLIPFPVLSILVMAADVLCTAYCLQLLWKHIMRSSLSHNATLLCTVCIMASDPFFATLAFGQINIFLLTLICMDFFRVNTRIPMGVLLGICIAIKLTPAVFVLYFLLRWDRKTLRNTILSTCACFAGAYLYSPTNTLTYFSGTLSHTERIGAMALRTNQSLLGVFAKLTQQTHVYKTLWFCACTIIVPAVMYIIHLLIRNHWYPEAFFSTVFIWWLCSPVAWQHHWVFLLPLIVCWYRRGTNIHSRAILYGVCAIIGIAMTHILRLSTRQLHPYTGNAMYNCAQFLLTNCYTWWAIYFLGITGITAYKHRLTPN